MVAGALASASVAMIAVAPPASAAVDCTYDQDTRIVTVPFPSSGGVRIQVPGGNSIAVGTPGSATFCADPDDGTLATPSNTETIQITGTPGGLDPHSSTIFIDQRQGVLRPGFTLEPGGAAASEIEVEILSPNAHPEVEIEGAGDETLNLGDKGDHIVVGSNGINLNADAETDDDVDVYNVNGGPVSSYLDIHAEEGDDRISFAGGEGTGSAVSPFSATAKGGPGDDELISGIGTSNFFSFYPGPGNDLMDGTNAGRVTASYLDATSGVTVDLGVSTPQAVGGGLGTDTLLGVKDLRGSDFGDVLTGNDADNLISAGDGSDTVVTGAGDDIVTDDDDYRNAQPPGDDSIDTGPGEDSITTTAGDNDVDAGPDDDTLWFGPSTGQVDGGTGDDLMYLRDATGGVTLDLALTGEQALGGGLGPATVLGVEDVYGTDYDDVLLGTDGDNSLYGNAGGDTLAGRGGDDYLSGAASSSFGAADGDDDIDGGPGEDSLSAGVGTNIMTGGADDDRITNGAGDDDIDGGPGTDLLTGGSLSSSTVGSETVGMVVDLTVAGPQSAGPLFGTDTVASIENLTGTRLGDQLRGDGGPNQISGGSTSSSAAPTSGDVLDGRGGDDRIWGFFDDVNPAQISGGPGSDTINAGDAGDSIDPGPGLDDVDAGGGNDTVAAADGETDQIDCGADHDTITSDAVDDLTGCETVNGSGPPPTTPPAAAPDTVVEGLTVKLSKTQKQAKPAKAKVKLRVGCSEPCTIKVTGKIAFDKKKVSLTPTQGTVSSGSLKTFTVKVKGKKSRTTLALFLADKRHRATAILVVVATDAAGNRTKTKAKVILKRK